MSVLSELKKNIERLGFIVEKKRKVENKQIEFFPFILEYIYSKNRDSFSLVQIGANDGVRCDPLNNFISNKDLKGILIEPLPDMFAKLQNKYKNNKNIFLINAAVSDNKKDIILYRVMDGAYPEDHWAHGIASMDRNNVLSHRIPEKLIESIAVQSITISSALERFSFNNFDLLQVDTEGHDDIIVKSTINSGFKPALIHYEHCHLRIDRRDHCVLFLQLNGYLVHEGKMDTIAIKSDLI